MSERKKKDYGIGQFQFEELWETSETADEAVNRFVELARTNGRLAEGETVKKNVVLARAAVYRKKGAKLKHMPKRNSRKLNVEELNRRIQERREAQV